MIRKALARFNNYTLELWCVCKLYLLTPSMIIRLWTFKSLDSLFCHWKNLIALHLSNPTPSTEY